MLSTRANHNLLAVSAGSRETAVNTEQTLDLSLAVGLDDIIALSMRRQNNSDEATGLEEPDYIYDNGATSQASFKFPKAQPQHFAFILAYALGLSTPAAAGTGYQHTITPISGDIDLDRSVPSFSAMQRYGKTILKRRFLSMFVDGFTASFKKDDFVALSADIKGTGAYVDNVTEETVSAAGNVTSLTLAANGVQGSTAQDRLDNVQRIRVELAAGVWTEVAYSAVSSATPAVITITAPAGTATAVNYKILYTPTEAAAFTFPAKVQETPLRVSQLQVNMGGTWNGTTFSGGRTLSSEIGSIEWKFSNKLAIEFFPGSDGAYASGAYREGREQSITIDRKMRETIFQRHTIDNSQFGLRLLAEGALYDDPHKYQVEIIFPKLALLAADPKVDGKVMGETGNIQVLEDATYGSVICRVKNLATGYAQ